jgi:hypothetical protein
MNVSIPLRVGAGSLRIEATPATAVRVSCLAYGAVLSVLCVGFFTRAPWATAIWPWGDARMSFVFLAAIAAAVAAASIWLGLAGEPAAIAGVALSSVVTNLGIAAYLAGRAVVRDEPGLLTWVVGSLGFFAASLAIVRWSLRQPVRDPRPAPGLVRWAFLGYTGVLLAVGVALVFQVDHVFPWDLAAGTSTLFGAIFLGAASFFGYAAIRPRRALATGQLWAFLAYDLVLLIPYAGMIGKEGGTTGGYYGGYYGSAVGGAGDGVNERSLVVYLAVLAFSAGLSLWYGVVRPLAARGLPRRRLSLAAERA